MGSQLLFDGRALATAEALVAAGLDRRRASFELCFEALPRHVGFAVIAGVEQALDQWRSDGIHTSTLEAAEKARLMSAPLTQRLKQLDLRLDFDAVPEGTVVFAETPIATLEGPLLDAVLMKPILASCIERASIVATAAARLTLAAGGDAVVEATSAAECDAQSALGVARAAHVGGAHATTNAVAAMALQMPFRAPRLDAIADVLPPTNDASPEGWSSLPDELLLPLDSDDEEAALVELKRLGHQASGWLAARLTTPPRSLRARFDLVALEEDGAWKPHRPADPRARGGRKILVRYTDRDGRLVADVVHLHNERMTSERAVGAAALAPLARARIRAGRPLSAIEPAADGHHRFVVARGHLPPTVTALRNPSPFPIQRSDGVVALDVD